MKTPKAFHEAGVIYYVPPFASDETLPYEMCRVRYYWKHKPTGRTGSHAIMLDGPGLIHGLIGHWNRTEEWEYSVVPFD